MTSHLDAAITEMEHDPLEVFEFRIFTSARLRQAGDGRAPFGYQLIEIERCDGATIPMGVESIARCADLIAELNPKYVRTRCAVGEDEHAVLLALGVADDGEQQAQRRRLH